MTTKTDLQLIMDYVDTHLLMEANEELNLKRKAQIYRVQRDKAFNAIIFKYKNLFNSLKQKYEEDMPVYEMGVENVDILQEVYLELHRKLIYFFDVTKVKGNVSLSVYIKQSFGTYCGNKYRVHNSFKTIDKHIEMNHREYDLVCGSVEENSNHQVQTSKTIYDKKIIEPSYKFDPANEFTTKYYYNKIYSLLTPVEVSVVDRLIRKISCRKISSELKVNAHKIKNTVQKKLIYNKVASLNYKNKVWTLDFV